MSGAVVHEIVSNVDTIIILKNPCVEFAEWGEPAPSTAEEIAVAKRQFLRKMKENKVNKKKSKKEKKSEAKKRKAAKAKELATNEEKSEAQIAIASGKEVPDSAGIIQEVGSNSNEHSVLGTELAEAKQENASTKVAESEESGHNDSSQHIVEINAPKVEEISQIQTKHIEEEGIRFRVCSGSLMSASPWFNRVLKTNGWMESGWNPVDRTFHISAEDWDEEAFIILMNIFHHRNRKVPRTVTLEMLAKIALLVDYYECGESIELFADIWIAGLKEKTPIPNTYCRDLILWIWVSWAFGLSELLKQTTAVAIHQCTEPVRNLGLPIPAYITDEIDLRRYQAIESVISALHAQLNVYRSATYSCPFSSEYSFRCGCMLLGALTKELDSAYFMSPRPGRPFFGQSFDSICGKTRLMRSEGWYHNSYDYHDCTLYTFVNSVADLAVASLEGISLREKSAQNGVAS